MRKIDDDYITLQDLAVQSGVTRTTLYSHIARGHLKAKKVGYFTVVKQDDADAFVKRLHKLTFKGKTVMVFQ